MVNSMSVYSVKAWEDSDQNFHSGYLILVEFQRIFIFFLDFSLFEYLQRFVLLSSRKKKFKNYFHNKNSISKNFY